MDHRIPDAEVLAAEEEWRRNFPEALSRRPSETTHRLVREARGLSERYRGAFFFKRSLWQNAAECYGRSLKWLPTNGEAWFCLGYARDKLNLPAETVKVCYEEAIHWAPRFPGRAQISRSTV
jgi:hypothetical protein